MSLLGPEGREQMKIAGRVSALGIELGISIALGAYAGRWLDGEFGTRPWLMTAGMLLGLAAAGLSMVRVVQRAMKQMDSEGPDDETPPDT